MSVRFLMRALILVTLVACSLPHVEPQPRSEWAEGFMLARVHSSCTEPFPFNDDDPSHGVPHQPDIVWRDPIDATGVLISERHILTAGHADLCPTIPNVSVAAAGRHLRMWFERGEFRNGGPDIARLEIASAEHFAVGIPPPRLGAAVLGSTACFATLHGRSCGSIVGIDHAKGSIDVDATTLRGDSGSPLYNEAGELLGINTRGGDGFVSTAADVGPYWLQGT